MSDEGSQGSLNLRGFRMQRKPSFSHTSSADKNILQDSSDCSPVVLVKPARKAPLTTDESDPESSQKECHTNGQVCSTFFNKDKPPSAEKVVVIINDDDDVETSTSPVQTAASPSKDPTSNGTATSASISRNYTMLSSRPKKTEAVLEKEKQMRFLKEKFPTIESMTIHDILSKHKFSIDDAITELVMKEKAQNWKPTGNDYEKWKQQENDAQKDTATVVATPVVAAPVIAATVSYNAASNVTYDRKRRLVNFSSETRKKAKRLKTEVISDDSDNETGNAYKDNRVFDSDEDSDIEITNELTKDKKKVLEFFQMATINELQLMSSCSKKKAEAIVECRPFQNWIDLHTKLTENKNLNPSLLNAAHEVLATRHNVQNLMVKCKNLANQMERAAATGAVVERQPSILAEGRHLTSYQMIGLNWLATLHSQQVNGILADEMGLGKTIQVIAFLAYLKEIGADKEFPHLVIVPSSTLDNWRLEFEKWCPTLKVLMYYGTTEERKMYRIEYWSKGNLSNYDVILTTYTMLNTPEEKKMFKVTQMHYVIFDEAHMLKNMNTRRYENLIRIKALNRILLTGTPLQNNLLELMSLLIFVMPSMFAGKSDDLKSLFQKTSQKKKGGEEEEDIPTFERSQIQQAKDIMKPFLLRRLKRDVLKDLPKKSDQLIKVELVPTQREQYENLVADYQNLGKAAQDSVAHNAMTVMTDLRKLSNHPLLLRYHYQYDIIEEIAKILAVDPNYKDTVKKYIIDDLLYMSDFEIHTLCKQYKRLNKFLLPDNLILTCGKFMYLDKKLEELKEGGHRVLIFSQYVILLDVMEEYLQLRRQTYLRLDGSTPVTTRQELIDQYTNDPDIFIFLLSTRAGGLGINLTAADTVIIHDIDFNPYNDKQAEDRCHRIGQTRPVQVFRLISKGTIEEGMWLMNQEKLKLEKEVTTDESENPDIKSVVRLLSSVLGIDGMKATSLASSVDGASSTNNET